MTKNIGKQKFKEVFSKKNLRAFINKFGFYIILLICLGIIATTAFLTQGKRQEGDIAGENSNDGISSEAAVEDGTNTNIDISITDVTDPEPSGESPSEPPASSGKTTNDKNTNTSVSNTKSEGSSQGKSTVKDDEPKPQTVSAPGKDTASSSSEAGRTSSMIMPVSGKVIQAYSVDSLVYSKTLKEWTTHTGMDIAGDLGDEVRAALAGKVESIEEDPLEGIVITLDHGKGLKTVYIGLSTRDMVKEGQQIETGQVISGIGRTAAFEIMEDPHLHFEVYLEGDLQNPQDYLKEKQA